MHIIMGHIHQQVSSPHCLENELSVGSVLYVFVVFSRHKLFWIEFEFSNWTKFMPFIHVAAVVLEPTWKFLLLSMIVSNLLSTR